MKKLVKYQDTLFYKLLSDQYEEDIPRITRGKMEYESINDEVHVINDLEGDRDALSSIGIC